MDSIAWALVGVLGLSVIVGIAYVWNDWLGAATVEATCQHTYAVTRLNAKWLALRCLHCGVDLKKFHTEGE